MVARNTLVAGAAAVAAAVASLIAFLPAVAADDNYTSETPFPTTCSVDSETIPSTAGAYPSNWMVATIGVLDTQEWKDLVASVDLANAPDIAVRTGSAGVLNTQGYDTATDPDCWWTATGCVTSKHVDAPDDIIHCPEPDTLGLTFDDGPNCTEPYLYNFLKENNQIASLFLIGSNIQNHPSKAKEAFNDGHHIAVHTWSHPMLTTLSNEAVLAELYYSRKIIKEWLGVTPLLFRPPYGDIDDRVRWIANKLNLRPVMWALDSFDWSMIPAGSATPEQVDANFQSWIDKANNGTFSTGGVIQLQHELNEGTIDMAIQWYPKVKAAFKNVVNVATCQNISHPYAETDCERCTFATFKESGGSSNATDVVKGNDDKHNSGSILGVSSFGYVAAVAALFAGYNYIF